MASTDTLETALSWYRTGVEKIATHSTTLGISYLDKAIAVFSDNGDLERLTLARHHRLRGLVMEERHEEVDREFAEIMHGYTQLGANYGKALLIIHLGESLAAQGRWERAASYFNLASVIAENFKLGSLMTYACLRQALLFHERDNHVHAVSLLQRAEQFVLDDPENAVLARLRHQRGEILFDMGEASEAAGLLEDAQAMYVRANRAQPALKSLGLLKRIYEATRMTEDLERISELMHRCGQHMLRSDSLPRDPDQLAPPIDPSMAVGGGF